MAQAAVPSLPADSEARAHAVMPLLTPILATFAARDRSGVRGEELDAHWTADVMCDAGWHHHPELAKRFSDAHFIYCDMRLALNEDGRW